MRKPKTERTQSLIEVLKQHKISYSELSRRMGFNERYITGEISKNRINERHMEKAMELVKEVQAIKPIREDRRSELLKQYIRGNKI